MKIKGRTKNSQKGITLIALVITIIVLLILAGVGINMAINSEGLFDKATQAKIGTTFQREKEEIELAKLTVALDRKELNAKTLQEVLSGAGADVTVTPAGKDITVKYNDSNNEHTITPDGQLSVKEKIEVTEVWYKIDGTTVYLNNSQKDETYKKAEEQYYYNTSNGYFSDDYLFPEWAGTITMGPAQWNPNILVPTYHTSTTTKVIIENLISPSNTACWFAICAKLTQIEGMENLDTSNTTDMNKMFWKCENIESLDVSNFNTSKVTNMADMFGSCRKLKNINVSGFDTSKVTDMNSMFDCCSAVEALDVSGFNTSKVTDMAFMFSSCEKIKNLDLKNFDTKNVTDMECMICYCTLLESIDVSNFNTSKVTLMDCMFECCENLTQLDLSSFDMSNVEDLSFIFDCCYALQTVDMSNTTINSEADTTCMFADCSELTKIIVKDAAVQTAVQSILAEDEITATVEIKSANETN